MSSISYSPVLNKHAKLPTVNLAAGNVSLDGDQMLASVWYHPSTGANNVTLPSTVAIVSTTTYGSGDSFAIVLRNTGAAGTTSTLVTGDGNTTFASGSAAAASVNGGCSTIFTFTITSYHPAAITIEAFPSDGASSSAGVVSLSANASTPQTGALTLANGTATTVSNVGRTFTVNVNGLGATNTSFGTNALAANSTGTSNTALGVSALQSGTALANATAVGYNALTLSTATQPNTAVGALSLSSATTASANTAVGYQALQLITTSGNSTAVGHAALRNCTAQQNSAFGATALNQCTTGTINDAFGSQALRLLTTGANNTAFGGGAMQNLIDGSFNVAVGVANASLMTHGSYNTLLGYNCGHGYNASESSNICIGYIVVGTAGESNVLRIGNGTGTGNGQINQAFISGIRGITTSQNNAVAVLVDSNGQLGTVSSSARYKENIRDMKDHDVLSLRPRNFNYKGKDAEERGLIAEEVADVVPELVVCDEEGRPETVKYHELPVLLLAELKKAREEISQLRERVSILEK